MNEYGDYWSRTVQSSTSIYSLNTYSNYVYPSSYNYGRYSGFPLRCLYPGSA